jgi:hypothetical protein
MKYFSVIVSLIIAAAILVAAYSVGLLVRHGRGAGDGSASPAVTGPNEADAAQEATVTLRPGRGRGAASEGEMAAEIKQARAEELERMGNLTEEEKQEFRDRIRQRMGGRGGEGTSRLTPEQKREMMEKLRSMPREEREAFEARLRESRRVAPPAASDANAPADANAVEETAIVSDAEPDEPNEY